MPNPHRQSSSPNSLEFSCVHGANVSLSRDNTVAARNIEFRNGVLFTHRPVKINEVICLKILKATTLPTVPFHFGFTTHNPLNLSGHLPTSISSNLHTHKKGYWCGQFKDGWILEKGSYIYFYVNSNGNAYLGVKLPTISLEKEHLLVSDVNVYNPLWAVIDIFSIDIKLQLLDFYSSNHGLNPQNMI